MLSSNDLSYEKEVCNILKETAIHQKLEELREKTKSTGREQAFNVCSDGKITEMIEGVDHGLDMKAAVKECNYQVDLDIHSHPPIDNAYPSKLDFITDITIQPRIASCIYSPQNDALVSCYRTSDELRNKFRPLIVEDFDKVSKAHHMYELATDPKKRDKLRNEWERENNNYMNLLTDIAKEIVSDIYPYLKYNFVANPYSREIDDYAKYTDKELRFGNFGDVWLEDCYGLFHEPKISEK